MTIALTECEIFFKEKGLRVNAKKCASMRVLPVKGKKSMKVITEEHRKWCQQGIASLDIEKLAKYLGVNIRHNGGIILPRKEWEQDLDRLKKSHLTPIQKVQAIRETVCGKILYQLRLSNHRLEVARKLDRMIQKAVKEILHLPMWVPTDWIHHRHGANIPNLMRIAMLSRKKASEEMKKSNDPIARTVGDRIDPLNGERLERLEMINANKKKIKDEQQKKSETRIEQQSIGKAIITMFGSKVAQDWIWIERGLSPGDKL